MEDTHVEPDSMVHAATRNHPMRGKGPAGKGGGGNSLTCTHCGEEGH